MLKRARLIGSVLAAVAVLASCGGSDDASAKKDDSKAPAAVVDEELATAVEGYLAPPEALTVTEPVSKKAEKKTIAILVCGVVVCEQFADAEEEAAEELGWTTERIALGTSPEEFAQAADRALEMKPDAIVISGLGRELFEPQLAAAEKAGIPVLFWASTDVAGDGITASIIAKDQYDEIGRHLAEWVAVDSGGSANVELYSVAQYVTTEAAREAFEARLEEVCADCEVTVHMVSASDIGTRMPSIVTGNLQKNPDADYLFCGFGGLCGGVPSALKDAGITLGGDDGLTIFSQSGGQTELEGIFNGEQELDALVPISLTGWHIIDTLQRIFNGDTVVENIPVQLITKDYVTDPSDPDTGSVEGFRDQYRKLWLLDG